MEFEDILELKSGEHKSSLPEPSEVQRLFNKNRSLLQIPPENEIDTSFDLILQQQKIDDIFSTDKKTIQEQNTLIQSLQAQLDLIVTHNRDKESNMLESMHNQLQKSNVKLDTLLEIFEKKETMLLEENRTLTRTCEHNEALFLEEIERLQKINKEFLKKETMLLEENRTLTRTYEHKEALFLEEIERLKKINKEFLQKEVLLIEENTELKRIVEENQIKELEEKSVSLVSDPFDSKVELNKIFDSWFSKESTPSNYLTHYPNMIKQLKAMIVASTNEIKKKEEIITFFSQSYEVNVNHGMGSIYTKPVVVMFMVTNKHVYVLGDSSNYTLRFDSYWHCQMHDSIPHTSSYKWCTLCDTPSTINYSLVRQFTSMMGGKNRFINNRQEYPIHAPNPINTIEESMKREQSYFFSLLGLKQCTAVTRTRNFLYPELKGACLHPGNNDVCGRHEPYPITPVGIFHVITDTNVIVDPTTYTIIGWMDEDEKVRMDEDNPTRLADYTCIMNYDLHCAPTSERKKYVNKR